jgi:dinuclear metal center YbgI/SA1388 family protein
MGSPRSGLKNTAMLLCELEKYTGQLLQADRFKDYAPNGLQVAGRAEVNRLMCAVTASEAAINAAIAWRADALLVHHGYFWRGEDPRIIGSKKRRLAKLLAHDINLLAYHLPLDSHPDIGNNAMLGKRLGVSPTGRFGEQDVGWLGRFNTPLTLAEMVQRVEHSLGRQVVAVGAPDRLLTSLAWCTGGAQGYLGDAVAAGCDCFLTGEASERSYHDAMEAGVAFVAAGHHATERYGVQALGVHLADRFGLAVDYVESANPF